MYLINSNFMLLKSIGGLSESRIGLLKNLLNDQFPETIQPIENTLMFRKGATALIVSPEQIVFAFQGDEKELNLNEVANLLLQVNEILGLSDKAIVAIRVELIESTKDNSMEQSKKILGQIENLDGIFGVGLRLIINQQDFQGDVRIEPFLKDNQKAFYNVVLDSKGEISLSTVEKFIDGMYTFGIEKSRETGQKIFSL